MVPSIKSRLNNLGSCTSASYASLPARAGTYSISEFSVIGPSTLCSNSAGYFSSTYIGGDITNYFWGWSAGFVNPSGQGTPYLSVYTGPNFQSGQIALQL